MKKPVAFQRHGLCRGSRAGCLPVTQEYPIGQPIASMKGGFMIRRVEGLVEHCGSPATKPHKNTKTPR